jgi:hypothetical protein
MSNDDKYMTFKTIAGVTLTTILFIYLINLLIYENFIKGRKINNL